MNFGEAINELKEGKMVCRKGWNGKDMFVFRQVPAIIDIDIVPKMQSLPAAVKAKFIFRELGAINYSNQLVLVDKENNISGWSPTTSDTLATDWKIYE